MQNTGHSFDAVSLTEDYSELVFTAPFGLISEVIADPDPDSRRGRSKKNPPDAATTAKAAAMAAFHQEIQRPFKGSKKANVKGYRDFIRRVMVDGRAGDTPEIVLYCENALAIQPYASASSKGVFRKVNLTIPLDAMLIAVDGETQLAARFDLMEQHLGSQWPVVIRLHHGKPIAAAAQIFFERNTKGVNVPRSVALTKDSYDPVNTTASDLRVLLGDLVVDTGGPGTLGFSVLCQAVLWSTMQTLNAPKRRGADFDTKLADARDHLQQRLIQLRPVIAEIKTLRKAAAFIAATDRRVSMADIAVANWESVSFASRDLTGPAVNNVVNLIRGVNQTARPLLDAGHVSDTDLRDRTHWGVPMALRGCSYCGAHGPCYGGCQCEKCIDPDGYAAWKQNNPEEYADWLDDQRLDHGEQCDCPSCSGEGGA